MQEEYDLNVDELALENLSDEDMFNKHVIGDDHELGRLNSIVASYFQRMK